MFTLSSDSVICVFSEFIETFYDMSAVTLIEKSVNNLCIMFVLNFSFYHLIITFLFLSVTSLFKIKFLFLKKFINMLIHPNLLK